jgi:4-diphosphocytidyl-2-C-methyl-D-erythritol kinase
MTEATVSPTDVWVWPAPAKLNLFLHVVGRRADGYHLLQTVFQLLEFGDEIRIRVDASGEITRLGGLPGLPVDQDLAVRAARLLQSVTGCPLGADLDVVKRVPAGAGLGGGSSDAATVLVGLNAMWGTGLAVDELVELGARLGADVPVFVRGHSAWAEGVGDQLTPIELPERWYVIVFPEEYVETQKVFADSALTRDTPQTTIPRFLSGVNALRVEPQFRNDLQPVVMARFPRVAMALEWLGGFGAARMSGSGASVFVAAMDRKSAESIAAQCPQEWKVFVTRGLPRSPLLDAAEAWRKEAGQSGQT